MGNIIADNNADEDADKADATVTRLPGLFFQTSYV